MAHALARAGVRGAAVIDPRPGRGLAYGGGEPLHLLNTRAINMSIDPEAPACFVDWLNATGAENRPWSGDDFAPRRIYGDYLASRLEDLARGGATVPVHDSACGIEPDELGWRVDLVRAPPMRARAVVLATGNARPAPLRFRGRAAVEAAVLDDPWDKAAFAAIPDEGTVLLVGTGLTAVDVAVTLLKRRERVRVLAVSRRGLLPRVHGRPPIVFPELERPFPTRARALYRRVRALAESVAGEDVQARHPVFLGLRPSIPDIWRGLPLEEKRRFHRHLRPWWEVERHRLAPEIAAVLEEGRAAARFEARRGRIATAEPARAGARVTLRSGRDALTLDVVRIVNCTGPDWRLDTHGDPFLSSVVEAGAQPHETGLGLAAGPNGEVLGAEGALPGLFALGPLTRGAFFEITAVPEIRAMASKIADTVARILSAQPA
jgi:uncharacterized NAD(P)/FAD-binding protein YdhS